MPVTGIDLLAVLVWVGLPAAGLVVARDRLRRAGSSAIGTGAVVTGSLGFAVMALAVLPSVADAAEGSFAGHMVQHLALGLVGPLLLVVGRAPELGWWLVPVPQRRSARARLGRLVTPTGSLRVATVAYVAVWFAWHVPTLYDGAVRHPLVHLVEHGTIIGVGFWFWASVAPHRRRSGAPIVALFAATLGLGFLGAVLSLSPVAFYEEVTATGSARLDDQHLGGLLMWTPGGLVHLVAAVVQLVRWLGVDTTPAGEAPEPEVVS